MSGFVSPDTAAAVFQPRHAVYAPDVSEATTIEAAGQMVRLSNPDKVFFPEPGYTKLDLANYYLEVADAALVHLKERPTI